MTRGPANPIYAGGATLVRLRSLDSDSAPTNRTYTLTRTPEIGALHLRNATAVFFLHEGEWRTAGRAVFNLNPDEAAAHFGQQYERVIV